MRRFALTLTFFTLCFTAAVFAAPKHDDSTIDEQLARDRDEVREFAVLIQEMKELNMPREKFDFWQISTELQVAAKREYEQAREHWGDEGTSDQASPPDVQTGHSLGESDFSGMSGDTPDQRRSTPAERVVRMKRILRESKGLEQFMATDEFDVLIRYHFLMDEFLGLMREDILQVEAMVEAVSPGRSGSR